MQLTIGMASNRNLEASQAAIASALAYCEARDAMLSIADNSGDAEKAARWTDCSPRLLWRDTRGYGPSENFVAAIEAATTPFVMPMGDDDRLEFDASAPSVDLATLGPDCIGVKPLIHIFTDEGGRYDTADFGIGATTPGQRIAEYTVRIRAGKQSYFNSTYYSIFRRDAYLSFVRLFLAHHPTKGAYFDWAFVMALLSYGRLPQDKSTVFHYNAANWFRDKSDDAIAGVYEKIGMPRDYEQVRLLLLYLDLFIFVIQRGSPLARADAVRTATVDLTPFIDQYAQSMLARQLSPKFRQLAEMLLASTEGMKKFQIALLMVDDFKPGLKDAYMAFFKAAAEEKN